MSGGSHNYLYSTIEDTYRNDLEYPILEDLLKDFCKVLKSLEWYRSGDTCKETYDKDVKAFINKWFKADKVAKIRAKSEVIKQLEDYLTKMKEKNK